MPTLHKVEPGDCINRIAQKYDFTDFELIWNDGKNAQLKNKRADPNLLFPGDAVFIPDKQQKTEARSTGQVHQFKINAGKKLIRIALEDAKDNRLKNVDFILEVGDKTFTGATDGDGVLTQEVPIDAVEAELKIQGHCWPVRIGYLNPVDQTPDQGKSGVIARLRNLGYDPGPIDSTSDDQLEAAVRAFQRQHQLPEDGKCDPKSDTIKKLIERHGC